jgi:hypothetical protein
MPHIKPKAKKLQYWYAILNVKTGKYEKTCDEQTTPRLFTNKK